MEFRIVTKQLMCLTKLDGNVNCRTASVNIDTSEVFTCLPNATARSDKFSESLSNKLVQQFGMRKRKINGSGSAEMKIQLQHDVNTGEIIVSMQNPGNGRGLFTLLTNACGDLDQFTISYSIQVERCAGDYKLLLSEAEHTVGEMCQTVGGTSLGIVDRLQCDEIVPELFPELPTVTSANLYMFMQISDVALDNIFPKVSTGPHLSIMTNMLNSEAFHDMKIVSMSGDEIGCNRDFLAMHSKMLRKSLEDSNGFVSNRKLAFPFASVKTTRVFLEYIYTGKILEISRDSEVATQLMFMANYLLMETMEEFLVNLFDTKSDSWFTIGQQLLLFKLGWDNNSNPIYKRLEARMFNLIDTHKLETIMSDPEYEDIFSNPKMCRDFCAHINTLRHKENSNDAL